LEKINGTGVSYEILIYGANFSLAKLLNFRYYMLILHNTEPQTKILSKPVYEINRRMWFCHPSFVEKLWMFLLKKLSFVKRIRH